MNRKRKELITLMIIASDNERDALKFLHRGEACKIRSITSTVDFATTWQEVRKMGKAHHHLCRDATCGNGVILESEVSEVSISAINEFKGNKTAGHDGLPEKLFSTISAKLLLPIIRKAFPSEGQNPEGCTHFE